MLAHLNADMLFTLIAAGSLIGLWGVSALLLPWSDGDQAQVLSDLRSLTRFSRPAAVAQRVEQPLRRAA
jgi:multidrug efflux pump subunit AcrB